MGLSEYISKVGFVQRIILSKTELSVPGPYEDPPDVSVPFENDRLKVILLSTGLSSLLIYTVLNMMSIFVFYLSKMEKTLIREPILSIGPFPESGLERDSGLVWSKKNSKNFQNLLCRNFDKFGSCPLSLHAFSYPIKSRNCPDPLLGNIVGHDIGAFLSISLCEKWRT